MDSDKNVLIIASAGSGKTTHLIEKSLLHDGPKRTLLLTYTESNRDEIIGNFIKRNGYIPSHVKVQTWFSFILEHLVRPFQSRLFDFEIDGMQLVNQQSGIKYRTGKFPFYYSENDNFFEYYFNKKRHVYSDKLSKLAIRCIEKSNGFVIDRLSKIFENIFIDEVQDLAGYDLDILREFFKSNINIKLVGDPRQVTYLTHREPKYGKYAYGKIEDFIKEKCKNLEVRIDFETLQYTHRNNQNIANFASSLYPNMPRAIACSCCNSEIDARNDLGVFLVSKSHADSFLRVFNPIQLQWNKRNSKVSCDYRVLNFGVSKGMGFEDVLIYPTKEMEKWILDPSKVIKSETTIAKLYVGITRARNRVGIIISDKNLQNYKGNLKLFSCAPDPSSS